MVFERRNNMTAQTKGEKTRARVVREARKLIVEKGFKNTSINEIIAATGVKKGAMYFHFANKEDLGFSVLLDAKEEFFDFLDISFKGDSPYEQIENFFLSLLKQQENAHFVGGCLFGNTALEMSDSNERFAGLINEVFSDWIKILTRLLKAAQDYGQINGNIDAKKLAHTIVATLEGGIMMARLSKKSSDLADCIGTIRSLIKA